MVYLKQTGKRGTKSAKVDYNEAPSVMRRAARHTVVEMQYANDYAKAREVNAQLDAESDEGNGRIEETLAGGEGGEEEEEEWEGEAEDEADPQLDRGQDKTRDSFNEDAGPAALPASKDDNVDKASTGTSSQPQVANIGIALAVAKDGSIAPALMKKLRKTLSEKHGVDEGKLDTTEAAVEGSSDGESDGEVGSRNEGMRKRDGKWEAG